jgi:molybdopterin converting factor small subunit
VENPDPGEADLAKVNINFIGLWRRFLGVRSVTVNLDTIDDARDYVELNFGPNYWRWLRSRGIRNMQSVWDSSTVLLNGSGLVGSERPGLKDGDNLDLVPRVAGG